MADTIAVMNAGVIEQMGAPGELYDHPRTTFVANFLGQSNLIRPASWRARRRRLHDRGARHRSCRCQRVPRDRGQRVGRRAPREGGRCQRPDEGQRDGANRLGGGVVTDVSFVGVSTQYLVRMPWDQELDGLRAEHRRTPVVPCRGAGRSCTWSPEHTFLSTPARTHSPAPSSTTTSDAAMTAVGHVPAPSDAHRRDTPQRRGFSGYLLMMPGELWLAAVLRRPTSPWWRAASTTPPARSRGLPDDVGLAELRRRDAGVRPDLPALVHLRAHRDRRLRRCSASRWPTRSPSRPAGGAT